MKNKVIEKLFSGDDLPSIKKIKDIAEEFLANNIAEFSITEYEMDKKRIEASLDKITNEKFIKKIISYGDLPFVIETIDYDGKMNERNKKEFINAEKGWMRNVVDVSIAYIEANELI